jgi:DNA-binding NarL/FixJ family response regulator
LLAPTVARRLIEQFVHRPPRRAASPDALASLTPRAREVFALLARGRSNAELRDRVQAVILAYDLGVVRAGEP